VEWLWVVNKLKEGKARLTSWAENAVFPLKFARLCSRFLGSCMLVMVYLMLRVCRWS
jgi:hypothetical protein